MDDLPQNEDFQPLELNLVADDENASRLSSLSLVGKILSKKLINLNLAQMIIKRVWFTKNHVKLEQISLNVFLFSFKIVEDRNRVWNKRPWSINKAHLILREWPPDLALESIDFNSSTFWVQIHGLPLQYMSQENAIKIGALFPRIIQCETSSRINLVGKNYMRLQVDIDLRKPIPSGFLHKLGNRRIWIQLRYEGLLDFCFSCGHLRHAKSSCAAPTSHNQITNPDAYGAWLRAEVDAYTVVREGDSLKRIEIPRGETLTLSPAMETMTIAVM